MRNTIFSLGLLAVMGLSGSAKAQTTIIAQGSCGNSLTWVLTSDSTFTISGSGDMADYIGWQEMIIDSTTIPGSIIISESDTSDAPWYSLRNVIKTAVIGDSVTTIGAYAFWDCQNLTSVAIPDSIIRIGSRAFCKCWSLISVTIPGSVTTWGDFTFDACIGLVSVIIESGVTSIGNYAFCYCSSLTSVTIPNSVATIENSSFYVCENLTSVTLPDSLISIGNYAFGSCGLTSIAIPNSVTSIGTYAFASCDSLATVTIGNSVATIGGAAFQNCSGLKSITVHAIIPPVMPVLLTIPVFRNVPDTIPVYIPCGTYNDYSTASEWNYFSNFIEMPTDTGF
ncbi:MAG: leucine-rich repeat domain-containing protein, partial [Lentimicrobiaceae bacterium]|nr:leucine-rich repeat domain-containing protein [Lentimicrobiaceae bacterium]